MGRRGEPPKPGKRSEESDCASSGSLCAAPSCPQSQGVASWFQSPEQALPPMLASAFLQGAADAYLYGQALGQPSCRAEVGTNLPSSQIACGGEVTLRESDC